MSERWEIDENNMKPRVGFLRGPHGAKVAFATHGQGPTVVCPAWWVSHLERDFAYPPFRSFFEALGQTLTVVRYDRPGMGLSDSPAVRWSLDDEVLLLRSVLEHLGNTPVSIFGVSSGGPPAIALAASEPERVRRLVLYGTYADGSELADPAVREAMIAMVRAHWGFGSRTLADIFVPDLSGPELEELGRWQRETTDGATAANLLHLTYDMNVRASLGRVRTETMVIHRRGDRAVPFEAGRRVAAAVEGARLVALEGRAHPPWEGGAEVAQLVSRFLSGSAANPAATATAPTSEPLDVANCELVIDGKRTRLTRLELGVLQYLEGNPGRVVKRNELLEHVWSQQHVGSNVIETVIRSIRQKLGPLRASIETVTGHGYRFRGWGPIP
jgi:pimeloyl-ACP methyl ester carboxylesterase